MSGFVVTRSLKGGGTEPPPFVRMPEVMLISVSTVIGVERAVARRNVATVVRVTRSVTACSRVVR